MEISVVAEGLQFPEGPIAIADGSVLLVEVARGTLTRVLPDGRSEVLADTKGGPNGAAIGSDGAVYVCNNGGFNWVTRPDGKRVPHGIPAGYAGGSIQRVDLDTGNVATLYSEDGERQLRGPNDIVFDATGGFWFTDFGRSDDERIDVGHIYYARPDGSRIRRVRSGMITPNGIGLAPDGRTLYVAETRTSRVWAFSVSAPGVLGPRHDNDKSRSVVMGPLPGHQMLDSLALENGGNVCVATIGNGGISVFEPGGGVEHVALPDAIPTNICFGGDDMRDAYVTGAQTGRLFRMRWPRPGLRLAFNP